MPKVKNIIMQEFRSRPFGYIVQAGGVLVLILNIWLGTKLAPMAKSVDEVVANVSTMEKDIAELQSVSRANQDIVVKLENITVSLDEMKARIERIDNRLAKHMGI